MPGYFHYALDGVGQLAHLDSILSLRGLDGVQWVPGDGKPGQEYWPEVYRKIYEADKKIQIWGGFECLEKVISHTGGDAAIHHKTMILPLSEGSIVRKKLAEYGVE